MAMYSMVVMVQWYGILNVETYFDAFVQCLRARATEIHRELNVFATKLGVRSAMVPHGWVAGCCCIFHELVSWWNRRTGTEGLRTPEDYEVCC